MRKIVREAREAHLVPIARLREMAGGKGVNRRLLGFLVGMLALFALAANAAEPRQALTALASMPPARDFVLNDLDGKSRRLSELRGKVVLVNFWATWCPPCRRELPSMERLWRLLNQEDFVVLAVNVGEDIDTVFAFTGMLETAPTFPILLDRDSAVLKAWPVKGLPTTFVVDREGRVVYRAVGGRDFDNPELVMQIRGLLQGAR